MPISIRIDAIRRQGGKVYIRCGKVEEELDPATIRGMEEELRGNLRRLAISLALHRLRETDPQLSNPETLIGRVITIDPSIASVVRIT